jgi:hypothetical protein
MKRIVHPDAIFLLFVILFLMFSWKRHLVFNGVLLLLSIIGIRIQRELIRPSVTSSISIPKFTLIIILLAGSTGCLQCPKYKTGLEGKPLPAFDLFLVDSVTHFNTADITAGDPIVIFCFSPYCPYCRAQMEDIVAHIDKIKNIRIFIVTSYPFKDFKSFYDRFHLNRFPNIKAGVDQRQYFLHYFSVPGVPYLAIYDTQKRLKQVLMGKTALSTIREIAYK